jgi:hypothetical protein
MNNIKLRKINDKKNEIADYLPTRASAISRGQQMRRKLLFTYYKFRCRTVVDVASAKRLNLPKTKSTLTLETLSWKRQRKHFSKNAAKKQSCFTKRKENLPTGPIVSNATGTISKQDLSRFIEK